MEYETFGSSLFFDYGIIHKVTKSILEGISSFFPTKLMFIYNIYCNAMYSISYKSFTKWGSIDITIESIVSWIIEQYNKLYNLESMHSEIDQFMSLYEFRILFTGTLFNLLKYNRPLFETVDRFEEEIKFRICSVKNNKSREYFTYGSELFLIYSGSFKNKLRSKYNWKLDVIQNYSLKFIGSLDLYIIGNCPIEPSIEIIQETVDALKLYSKSYISKCLLFIANKIAKYYNFTHFSDTENNIIIEDSGTINKIIHRQRNGVIIFNSISIKNDIIDFDCFDTYIYPYYKVEIIRRHKENIENTNIPTDILSSIPLPKTIMKSKPDNSKLRMIKNKRIICGIICLYGNEIYKKFIQLHELTNREDYITINILKT